MSRRQDVDARSPTLQTLLPRSLLAHLLTRLALAQVSLGTTAAMSAPAAGVPMNGHLSPDDAMDSTLVSRGGRDDSDARMSHSPRLAANGSSRQVQLDEHDVLSDSDASADDNASDDGDFDMQQSSPSRHEDHDDLEIIDDTVPSPTRASSTESSRPVKRKANVEEDEFIKANPELYGLRRSVRAPASNSAESILTATRPVHENNENWYQCHRPQL